eukprot:5875609-Prymnesium_polylepis.1
MPSHSTLHPTCAGGSVADCAQVSAAIELVVRHFQQRAVLYRFGQQVQLLVKPEVIKHYATFDELVSKLGRLSAVCRRRPPPRALRPPPSGAHTAARARPSRAAEPTAARAQPNRALPSSGARGQNDGIGPSGPAAAPPQPA